TCKIETPLPSLSQRPQLISFDGGENGLTGTVFFITFQEAHTVPRGNGAALFSPVGQGKNTDTFIDILFGFFQSPRLMVFTVRGNKDNSCDLDLLVGSDAAPVKRLFRYSQSFLKVCSLRGH